MTPRKPTAQDGPGSTIAWSDDLRVDRLFDANERMRSFGHVSERHRWPAPTSREGGTAPIQAGIDHDSRTRSGSAMEMPAPWTAQNAAHRALEISRPHARFPHSHSRFFSLFRKGPRRTEHDRYHQTADLLTHGQRPASDNDRAPLRSPAGSFC